METKNIFIAVSRQLFLANYKGKIILIHLVLGDESVSKMNTSILRSQDEFKEIRLFYREKIFSASPFGFLGRFHWWILMKLWQAKIFYMENYDIVELR